MDVDFNGSFESLSFGKFQVLRTFVDEIRLMLV